MKSAFHPILTLSTKLLLCLTVSSAGLLYAAPGDSHWDRQFGLPGVTNRVYALRFNGDKLYASGYAVGTGGLLSTNTGVDIFDGTNWSNAIGELSGSLCVVYDVGFLGDDMFVAGIFSKAGNVTSPGLAKWDGSDWAEVGFTGVALALASDGTNLFVGGSFTNVGGVLNTNIARYDGTNWYSLGGGVGYYNSLSSYVYVLELHDGQLYVGGIFTNAGDIAASNVAVWSGSSWSSIGTGPANGVNGTVSALAFQGDDLYVGGSFSTAGGAPALGVAKWSGGAWAPLGAGCKGGGVTCIGILGSDIYVGGSFTNVGGVSARAFAKWDGFSWTTWPITDGVFQYPLNDSPNRMVVKDGSLYIGGNFSQAGDVIANHAVRYDGSDFYSLGDNPANGFAAPPINVFCIGQAKDGIYVGGLFTAAGKTLADRIARWDGTNWNTVGGGTIGGSGTGNRVLAIEGRGSDVFVGGTFTNVGGIAVSNIAYWNGLSWSSMGLGFDSGVGVIAADANNVYAGGSFTNCYDPPYIIQVNRIARWDGFGWYNLGSGVNNTVNAIAVSGNNVYAGGTFTTAGGVTANRIAVWNGSNWSPLGVGSSNGVSGTVLAIAVNGSDVYVGGTFTSAGGIIVSNIAKWDGTNWSRLGSGATSTTTAEVRGLAFGDDGKLYCCGRFTNISSVAANCIARWDGTNWEALGSGFYADSAIVRGRGFAIRGDDVYVAGSFIVAGLTDSSGIARWNETIDFTPPFSLNFSRTQLLPGNVFKTRITSSEHATYAVEYTDDFATWTPLMTNSSTQLEFTNVVSESVTRRIFRARGIP